MIYSSSDIVLASFTSASCVAVASPLDSYALAALSACQLRVDMCPFFRVPPLL